MPRILSVGTYLPPYEVTQEATEDLARDLFKNHYDNIERLLRIFKNGQIKKRHFSVPLDWFREKKSIEERNDLFIDLAIDFGCKAIKNCLQSPTFVKKEIPEGDIDAIVFLTSSGMATPSIEARIMNRLPFSPYTKRIPIWGLACVGGASGLARAYEYCKAYPNAKVLVLSVELCSLTFQREDLSKTNLIGSSLFADGIASVLVVGDEIDITPYSKLPTVPKILATQSAILPNSEYVMGLDLKASGLHLVLDKSVPQVVKSWLKPVAEKFLADNKLTINKISHFITHPGGKKVLDAYQEILNLPDEKLTISIYVLENFGNMSSATVLYVLKYFMEAKTNKGDLGLLGALGPGFSSEFLLLGWE